MAIERAMKKKQEIRDRFKWSNVGKRTKFKPRMEMIALDGIKYSSNEISRNKYER